MKTIIYILAIFLIVSPVIAENVTVETSNVKYSSMYYDVTAKCNELIAQYLNYPYSSYERVVMLESHRQSMLMEKQNELLAEQNAILRNMTPKKMVCSKISANGAYQAYETCVEWVNVED